MVLWCEYSFSFIQYTHPWWHVSSICLDSLKWFINLIHFTIPFVNSTSHTNYFSHSTTSLTPIPTATTTAVTPKTTTTFTTTTSFTKFLTITIHISNLSRVLYSFTSFHHSTIHFTNSKYSFQNLKRSPILYQRILQCLYKNQVGLMQCSWNFSTSISWKFGSLWIYLSINT